MAINLKEGYSIEERGDGKWVLSTGVMFVYFDSYEKALKSYIERHSIAEAHAHLDAFFDHYTAVSIPLRMSLTEEENLEECICRGFSDHFLSREYRGYIKRLCHALYYQLGNWKEANRGRYDFEVEELKEFLLRLFDTVKDYEHEIKEWRNTYERGSDTDEK